MKIYLLLGTLNVKVTQTSLIRRMWWRTRSQHINCIFELHEGILYVSWKQKWFRRSIKIGYSSKQFFFQFLTLNKACLSLQCLFAATQFIAQDCSTNLGTSYGNRIELLWSLKIPLLKFLTFYKTAQFVL